MKKLIALAAACAATGLTLSPAVASAEEVTGSATVRYSDLDLTSAEGLEELDRRIDRAAKEVCELDDTTLGTRIRDRSARECYNLAKRSFETRLAAIIEEAQRGG